jgi:hypothetical protein
VDAASEALYYANTEAPYSALYQEIAQLSRAIEEAEAAGFSEKVTALVAAQNFAIQAFLH